MNARRWIPIAAVLFFLAAAAAGTAVPARAEGLETGFYLFSGFPKADSGADGVLVVPGTVIPLDAAAAVAAPTGAEETEAVARLADNLRRTLRLERIEVLYRHGAHLEVGAEEVLPPPAATTNLRLTVELQGYSADVATYRVRFTDGKQVFADTGVSVRRGHRAVVGGLDGEQAPYLFLALEPRGLAGPTVAGDKAVLRVGGNVSPPLAIDRPPPQYTEEARKARITGVVILQTVIDETGEVQEVKVLKGQPGGLSEAAVEAVRRWRFEPALLDGEPVAVYYNLTINFTLPEEKPPLKPPEKPSAEAPR